MANFYHRLDAVSKHGALRLPAAAWTTPELEQSEQTSFRHLVARWPSPSLVAQPNPAGSRYSEFETLG